MKLENPSSVCQVINVLLIDICIYPLVLLFSPVLVLHGVDICIYPLVLLFCLVLVVHGVDIYI